MNTHQDMRVRQRACAALLVAFFALTLAALHGCEGISAVFGGSNTESEISTDSYVGVWRASSVEVFGVKVGIAEVLGGNFEIELNADGTGEVRQLSVTAIPCKWTADGSTLTITGGLTADFGIASINADVVSVSAKLEGSVLIIDDYLGTGIRISLEQ